MAHRKFQHDKIQTVMSTWHNLEERKDVLCLDDNWLTQWDHAPEPLYFETDDEEFRAKDKDENSEFYLTRPRQLRCTDNKNIIVGPSYNARTFRPITNSEFLNLITDCVSGTKHEMVSVGSVRNRGRVFVSFKLQGMEKFVAAGRETFAYLNFGNGNDKSSVLFVSTSNVVQVCDNTFSFNLHQVENKNKDSGTQTEDDESNVKASVRHTKNAMIRLPELAKLVDKAVGVQREFAAEMDKLAAISCNPQRAEKLFAGFLGRKVDLNKAESFSTRARNQTEELVKLFSKGLGNNGSDLASAFNAVTDLYTHGFRSKNDRNMEKQFVSSEFGSAANNKLDFYNLIREPAKVKELVKRGDTLLALN